MQWYIVLIIITVVVLAGTAALYFFGRKLQKRQEDSQSQMQAAAQTVSILVIDKKKMKMKEASLPKMVIDQTPRYMRGSKVPIVKAKIGPKVMSLVCDPKVFDVIPVKKEVKAVISGIYIMDVKGLRGNLEQKKPKQNLLKKITGAFKKDNK
jgi:Na+-transporting NADH:ubiquinone oxidoreductase subunit NqrC